MPIPNPKPEPAHRVAEIGVLLKLGSLFSLCPFRAVVPGPGSTSSRKPEAAGQEWQKSIMFSV
jgi:hypothetical protein